MGKGGLLNFNTPSASFTSYQSISFIHKRLNDHLAMCNCAALTDKCTWANAIRLPPQGQNSNFARSDTYELFRYEKGKGKEPKRFCTKGHLTFCKQIIFCKCNFKRLISLVCKNARIFPIAIFCSVCCGKRNIRTKFQCQITPKSDFFFLLLFFCVLLCFIWVPNVF